MSTRTVDVSLGTSGLDARGRPITVPLGVELQDTGEFEVSELSLASYAALRGRGQCPFVAVPVALSKIFRHSCMRLQNSSVNCSISCAG